MPGPKNLFNDFHSRNGAPTGAEFYTLQQHAEHVDRKLAQMTREVKGNPASQLLQPEEGTSAEVRGGLTPATDTPKQEPVVDATETQSAGGSENTTEPAADATVNR